MPEAYIVWKVSVDRESVQGDTEKDVQALMSVAAVGEKVGRYFSPPGGVCLVPCTIFKYICPQIQRSSVQRIVVNYHKLIDFCA